ncbi:MAG: hypothetical protein IPP56_12790 [Bacteroidetes bacterium]|nr:hypothetical protein [Bacteroidota bacterium]MBK9671652.1 hypothetical protein [Bacteroidota bacterium]MBK9800544.1 hypothetical protein [Bacteroidota bacterium]MBP6412121.1 hypothetical protein [Bacteroidia bacterium]
MKQLDQCNLLKESIQLLENKQSLELLSLRTQFLLLNEQVKPVNLIKSTIHDLATAPDLRHDIVGSIIGLFGGYLSRRMIIGTTLNPIKNGIGALLQFVVGNTVSQHTNLLQSIGKNILHRILKNKKQDSEIIS